MANVTLPAKGTGGTSEPVVSTVVAGDGSHVQVVSPRTSTESQARAGKAFIASTGQVILAAAGHFRLTMQNPSASGKTIYLYKLVAFASAGPAYGDVYVNPTAGLPATAKAVSNEFIGHSTTAVAVIKADSNLVTPLSGGTASGITVVVTNSRRETFDLAPMIIPAGVTVGINVPFTGAATAVVNAYFWEE